MSNLSAIATGSFDLISEQQKTLYFHIYTVRAKKFTHPRMAKFNSIFSCVQFTCSGYMVVQTMPSLLLDHCIPTSRGILHTTHRYICIPQKCLIVYSTCACNTRIYSNKATADMWLVQVISVHISKQHCKASQ